MNPHLWSLPDFLGAEEKDVDLKDRRGPKNTCCWRDARASERVRLLNWKRSSSEWLTDWPRAIPALGRVKSKTHEGESFDWMWRAPWPPSLELLTRRRGLSPFITAARTQEGLMPLFWWRRPGLHYTIWTGDGLVVHSTVRRKLRAGICIILMTSQWISEAFLHLYELFGCVAAI